jgi:hypothetical protein
MVVLARGDAEIASWPLGHGDRPDLAVVDGLARLQCAARRLGLTVWLRDATAELLGLLDLCGLAAVVPGGPVLRVEVAGEAEEGEELGVEEVVMPDDPVA